MKGSVPSTEATVLEWNPNLKDRIESILVNDRKMSLWHLQVLNLKDRIESQSLLNDFVSDLNPLNLKDRIERIKNRKYSKKL